MTPSQAYTIQFVKKIQVAKDAYSFYFTRPAGFDFSPGQYNRWTLPITARDGGGSSRFFTISSSPLETDFLAFTTKNIESDFKKALFELKTNDEISIFGPIGQFTLDENDTRQKILLAGGIGITPFHSMVKYAAGKNLTSQIVLLASFSTTDEMVFYDELAEISKSYPTIRVVYTITKPILPITRWKGERGRITAELIKKYAGNGKESAYFIAGPPAMVDGIKRVLTEMGIPDESITLEQFTGY